MPTSSSKAADKKTLKVRGAASSPYSVCTFGTSDMEAVPFEVTPQDHVQMGTDGDSAEAQAKPSVMVR